MSLRLNSDESLFVIVDIQQKLAPVMWDGEGAIEINYKLLQAVAKLRIPYLVSEQYPQGIGHTLEVLSPLIDPSRVIEKLSFSCILEPRFVEVLERTNRKQVVVSGMETHVCVLQTVLDMIDMGYQVFVVADGVASRTTENKMLGLERMRQAGAQIVSSEMVLFEWLQRAGTNDFKAILPLIK